MVSKGFSVHSRRSWKSMETREEFDVEAPDVNRLPPLIPTSAM